MTLEFEELIRKSGVDMAVLRPIYESIIDQIPFPYEVKVMTGRSKVDGIGMFATEAIKVGDILAPASISGRRTPAGRYTNHSNNPNAEMVRHNVDNILLIACQDIPESAEVFVDYRQVWMLVYR
jgi:SET domain